VGAGSTLLALINFDFFTPGYFRPEFPLSLRLVKKYLRTNLSSTALLSFELLPSGEYSGKYICFTEFKPEMTEKLFPPDVLHLFSPIAPFMHHLLAENLPENTFISWNLGARETKKKQKGCI
jgi:hypothetical protein